MTRAIPARYQVIIEVEGLNRVLRGKYWLCMTIPVCSEPEKDIRVVRVPWFLQKLPD